MTQARHIDPWALAANRAEIDRRQEASHEAEARVAEIEDELAHGVHGLTWAIYLRARLAIARRTAKRAEARLLESRMRHFELLASRF